LGMIVKQVHFKLGFGESYAIESDQSGAKIKRKNQQHPLAMAIQRTGNARKCLKLSSYQPILRRRKLVIGSERSWQLHSRKCGNALRRKTSPFTFRYCTKKPPCGLWQRNTKLNPMPYTRRRNDAKRFCYTNPKRFFRHGTTFKTTNLQFMNS